jgi:hypothetical protein
MGKDDAAVVRAYLAGDRIPDIQARFGIADADELNTILRESGKVPLRATRRTTKTDRADAVIAGLRQLVEHQAKLIRKLEAQLEAERRAARARRPREKAG